MHAEPAQPGPRTRLATLLVQASSARSALAVLAPAVGAGGGAGLGDEAEAALRLHAVAQALVQEEVGAGRRAAQRAVMLRPAEGDGWRALAVVRVQAA